MENSITIDGKIVEIADIEGKTVLDIARAEGIYIPTLCSHPDLPPFGACRLCIVEIEGMKGFPTSCTTPAKPGMIIHTDTPALVELRKNLIELIMTEHPHFCITCSQKDGCIDKEECPTKAGQVTGCNTCEKREMCELRAITQNIGIDSIRYGFHYKNIPLERDEPLIERDYNLCILCGRCVRVCSEIRGFSAISFVNRGSRARVSTAFNQPHLDGACEFCGSCIDVCPTGALSARATRWQSSEKQTGACMLCQMGCNIAADVRFGKIIGISPLKDDPLDPGILCMYGHFSIPTLVNSGTRLKYPMIRKEGQLIPVSWDEAISHAAAGLSKYAPDQIGFVTSPFLSNEAAFMMHRLAREGFGSSNLFISSRHDIREIVTPVFESFGTLGSINSVEHLEKSDLIITIGSDDFFHSTLSTSIFCAKKAGAKIVVVDPCNNDLSLWSFMELRLATSQYRAFLALILRKLLESEKYERDFVETSCEGLESLQNSLDAFDIPELLLVAGIDEKVADDLVSLVLNSSSIHVILGNEVFHDLASGDLVRLALDLVLLKGNPSGLTLFSEGGNWLGAIQVSAMAGLPPGYDLAGNTQSSPENPPLLESIKALILTENVSPMDAVHSEFNILIDTHESPALKIANVVLPARAFTEIEGSFTPATDGVRYLKPVSGCLGNAFPDHSILQVLGRALNFTGFEWKGTGAIQAEIGMQISKCAAQKKEILSLLPIAHPDRLTTPLSMKADVRRFRSVDLESIVPDLRMIRQSRAIPPENVASPIIPEGES
jgi:predicted molibdopterin-dependent oxidoreductase YjgC